MLEAAAEVDTDIVGTGGLDKIVERDDEGGGEQAESDESFAAVSAYSTKTVAEEIDRIGHLKLQLQSMIDSYETKMEQVETA